jgi:hypothetical protein
MSFRCLGPPLTAAVLFLCTAQAFPAAALAPARLLTPSARTYEKIEFALDTGRAPDNPFDPGKVALDALITLPSSKKVKVPGFWFQDYSRSIQNPEAVGVNRIEMLAAEGKPGWRVRFSSGETGVHRVIFELKDEKGLSRSKEQSFTVQPGDRPGVLRVSKRNPQFFEDETGHAFFPIGQNLCMYQNREGTYYFDRLFVKLAGSGANYARLWQEYYVTGDFPGKGYPGAGGFAGFPLETEVTGLGRYDLESAWRLDYVSEIAERLNIRWQLSFEMTTWWERNLPKWKRNIYNVANGGPCEKPADYFTNATAREYVKRRLRYNVARWGWTTNLLAWELWNEVDNLDGFTSEACASWHHEMGGYLKQIDPWKHLVTTSWRDRKTFALPEIDIVQGHSYWDLPVDAAEYAMLDTDHLMRGFGKPFFFGEQGTDSDFGADPEGKIFHDCIWSTSLSGAAGTGMYWWWHNYIDPYDLYRQYAPLSRFVKDVDWPASKWQPVKLALPNVPVTLRTYGMIAGDRALIWIHDPLASTFVKGNQVKGPRQEAARLNVVGLDDGKYTVEWWDTSSGEVIRKDSGDVNHLRHVGYGLDLKPPAFWGDIAAKISRE